MIILTNNYLFSNNQKIDINNEEYQYLLNNIKFEERILDFIKMKNRAINFDIIMEHYSDYFIVHNNELYVRTYDVPLSSNVINVLNTIIEGKGDVKGLVNFIILLSLNPDKEVINDIFNWFTSGKFCITYNGNIIGYRNVDTINKNPLKEFASYEWLKLKRLHKNTSNKLIIKIGENDYKMIKEDDYSYYKTCEVMGTLEQVYNSAPSSIYTDKHTGKMRIELLKEVSMSRSQCDTKREACSRGLHIANINYYTFDFGDTALVNLVSPYDIVAVPEYENTKFRTCAYLPLGLAEVKDEHIIPWEDGTFNLGTVEGYLVNKNNKHIEQYKDNIKHYMFDKSDKIKRIKEWINEKVVSIG